MELRKRAKPSKIHNLGLSQDTAAEGRCSNLMWGTERSNATHGGDTGAVSTLGGSSTCSGSDILPRWPWRQYVSMAAGLLLAGLLALTQAWCVNAIHENLLWFSQLTVGVTTPFSVEPLINQQPLVQVPRGLVVNTLQMKSVTPLSGPPHRALYLTCMLLKTRNFFKVKHNFYLFTN